MMKLRLCDQPGEAFVRTEDVAAVVPGLIDPSTSVVHLKTGLAIGVDANVADVMRVMRADSPVELEIHTVGRLAGPIG